jgi:type IV fimbrial biogenesis protein FimT
MKKPTNISGFSLVELMVVIGVIALMAAIATPSLLNWLPNVRFRDASRGMLVDVQLAKMTAIQRNANVVAAFLADGSGYTIFVDDGNGAAVANNDTWEAGEQIIRTITMPANVVLSNNPPAGPFAAVPALVFRPTGLPAGSAAVNVFNNQSNHNAVLTVSVAGSITSQ